MIKRCLELEKLQLATEKIEDSRSSKTKQFSRQRTSALSLSKPRAQSARMSRAQSARGARASTKCTPDCTQVACVGDCPEKASIVPCSTCNKRSCYGSCAPTPYSSHSRLPSEAIDNSKNKPPRPTSCKSCSKETNPSKKINTQQTQLGRPKSSHSTYSQAKKSVVRQSLELKPSNPQLDLDLTMVIMDRPNTAPEFGLRSSRCRRGRETVAPHKSYHSQRRTSLSANTIRPVYGVTLNSPKRRARSAKKYIN